jgi:hypothetical protein
VFQKEGVEVQTGISVVSEVLVEAVRAGEEVAPALVRAVPEQFCDAPSPQCSAAKLGPSFDDLIHAQ